MNSALLYAMHMHSSSSNPAHPPVNAHARECVHTYFFYEERSGRTETTMRPNRIKKGSWSKPFNGKANRDTAGRRREKQPPTVETISFLWPDMQNCIRRVRQTNRYCSSNWTTTCQLTSLYNSGVWRYAYIYIYYKAYGGFHSHSLAWLCFSLNLWKSRHQSALPKPIPVILVHKSGLIAVVVVAVELLLHVRGKRVQTRAYAIISKTWKNISIIIVWTHCHIR